MSETRPMQPEHAALYAYIAETYRPDPEEERIARVAEESRRAEEEAVSYQDWIADNVKGTGYGDCAQATEAMAAAFPELRRVRGFYYCDGWGERQHWWLVDPTGSIVDPTAQQFPSKGTGEYVEYDGRPLPTGPCANCGEPVYDGSTCCSDDCGRAYVAWVCGNAATGRC